MSSHKSGLRMRIPFPTQTQITTNARAYANQILDTLLSEVTIVVALTVGWVWYVRDNIPDKVHADDVDVLHKAIIGTLTFVLGMRVHASLQTNREAFLLFCDACATLEMFQLRLLTVASDVNNISGAAYSAVFLPTVIKHALRGDTDIKKLYNKFGTEYYTKNRPDEVAIHGLNEVLDMLYENKQTDSRSSGVPLDAENNTYWKLLEKDIRNQLHANPKVGWGDKIITEAWTAFRKESLKLGNGRLGYSTPIGYSLAMWLAMAIYVVTLPFLLPKANSVASCIITSAGSVVILVMFHVYGSRACNPFMSSRTFQTVTDVCHAYTATMINNLSANVVNNLSDDTVYNRSAVASNDKSRLHSQARFRCFDV